MPSMFVLRKVRGVVLAFSTVPSATSRSTVVRSMVNSLLVTAVPPVWPT